MWLLLGPELHVNKMKLKYIAMSRNSQKGSLSGMQGVEEDLGQDSWNGCMHVFPGQIPSLPLPLPVAFWGLSVPPLRARVTNNFALIH